MGTEGDRLEVLIKKHEELIPNVQKTSVMVDLYWKCYAYGDELKPHVEFLDGIMLSSTREIAPSCIENVDELIERIEEGWDETKKKAQERLQLLNETKDAFIGYAENNETIANEFEIVEEEIKKVKKMFNLEAANADLKKRQDILKKSTDTINGLFSSINANMATMSITIPEDKKKILTKEIKAVEGKLEVTGRFKSTVSKIEELVAALTAFDGSLKSIDAWKDAATADAQAFKDELARITKYVTELQANTKIECDKYSNDVKFWAEYRTGIKEFSPWLAGAEKAAS